jgi:aminodeoxyfutalosine synthase
MNINFDFIKNLGIDSDLTKIAEKIASNQRIDEGDALRLFQEKSLGFVGYLANAIREEKHGDNTYFNRNFHIEPTNLCVYDCKFCSYSRLIKQREEGWEYTHEEMMDFVKKYDGKNVTEVHIVGGVLPRYDLPFYENLFREIKAHRPELHIKALTPVEFLYIFKKAKVSYEEGLTRLAQAGLDSIPGGGAEIFDPTIRQQIAADKCDGTQWLEMHRIWHKMGRKSNATILYGHIETYEHRIDHLRQLRALQDETGGFQTFIPLKFRNKDNQMSHIAETTSIEDMKNYAVSRIYLDNFDHIKAYWPMLGREMAQLSLSFGVDDIDGTIDDTTKIYSMAGSEEQNPSLSTHQLVDLIKRAGRKPIEIDTLYSLLVDYSDLDINEPQEVYVGLPVLN